MSVHTPDNRLVRDIRPEKSRDIHPEKSTGKGTITIDAPMPGVWQAVISDRGDAESFDWSAIDAQYLPATPIAVRAWVAGVDAKIAGNALRFQNRFAGFRGSALQTALGAIRSEERSIGPGELLSYDIGVTEGASLLVAQIERSGGAPLDADLFLFDCTGGKRCSAVRRGAMNEATERVIVERPGAGRWKAIIAASGSGSVQTQLLYSDFYTHPGLGALNITDALRERKPGETWEARVNTWIADPPKWGYRPIGVVWVQEEGRVVRGNPFASDLNRSASSYDVPLALEYFQLDGR